MTPKHLLRLALPVTLSMAALTARAQTGSTSWQELISKDSGFKISFPGTPPKVERGSQDSPAGKLATATWALELSQDAYYNVTLTEFPLEMAENWIPADVLQGSQSGAVANVNGKLVRDFAILVDDPTDRKSKHPGREFKAEVPGGNILRSWLVLAKNRLYIVMMVASAKKQDGDAQFKRFVGSFKLLPHPAK